MCHSGLSARRRFREIPFGRLSGSRAARRAAGSSGRSRPRAASGPTCRPPTVAEALPTVLVAQHFESGSASTEALLAGKIDFSAMFAANDQMASGASVALHRHGLRVPDDVSIVGFDDLLATRHSSPPRTTVNLSVNELGRRAATAMLDLLADRQPTVCAPEPELIVRASTSMHLAH